tara:strand:+ start:50 stop:463 length:414 start_codon:yes stop_codon:yes gene_type:complete
MKRIEILLVLLVVVFTFSGCGGGVDTPESLMGEMVELIKELNKELAALKTVDDLKKAESKLTSLGENLQSVKSRMDKAGDPSPEEAKRIMKKYGMELPGLTGGLMSNMQRIGQLAASDRSAWTKILSKIRPGLPGDF